MILLKDIDIYQKRINKERIFEGDKLEQLRDYYRIDLTYSSNALEGNTLTLSETRVIIEDGITIGGKSTREILEAIGHAEAFNYMFTLLKKDTIKEADILRLHYLFYNSIDRANAGIYREKEVLVMGSAYEVTTPSKIKNQMKKLCKWINENREKYHPVEFAALLHKEFVFIHPFIDGNGRLTRLLMNTALIQKGYLPIIIPPILRGDYISALEKAHTSDKDFIKLIAECEIQSQKDFMRFMHIELPSLDKGLSR